MKRDMDQQATPRPAFTKPTGGFIVVLALALFVGGWLYLDMITNELETKVDAIAVDLQAVRAAREGAKPDAWDQPGETKKNTYAAVLAKYRFQVDVPVGYRLDVTEGPTDAVSAYVVRDDVSENEAPIPDMIISVVSLATEPYASMLGKDEPGTRLVPTPDGKSAFWIRGWEDQAWDGSAAVLASFKVL